jgi:SRSO17 transposase
MIKTNVLVVGDFREIKELRKTQETYKKYLGTLGNSQLETEIQYLLNQFSLDTTGKDFYEKVKLVQHEIVERADSDWKSRIEVLNKETLQLL